MDTKELKKNIAAAQWLLKEARDQYQWGGTDADQDCVAAVNDGIVATEESLGYVEEMLRGKRAE